ncbi:hypothetical protein [Pontibacter populi]|uniref:Fibronectin type-III domain-containing protein n=1 Tax=Pontibacter populi TaxID=890055 RepID=A0ABV1RR23_9BACT
MNIRKSARLAWFMVMMFAFVSCLETKEEANPDPAVTSATTQANANATFNTLEVSGNVDGMGNDVDARGLVWNTTGNPTIADSKTTEANSTFTATVNDLIPNTTYFFKIYATTAEGTFYSDAVELKTRSLAGTTWDFHFAHTATISWNGDVTFNADGTTVYDEPAEPGVYYTEGTWSMTGNELTYTLDASQPNPTSYVHTGTLENNTMSGTYTFGPNDNRPWTAVLK